MNKYFKEGIAEYPSSTSMQPASLAYLKAAEVYMFNY